MASLLNDCEKKCPGFSVRWEKYPCVSEKKKNDLVSDGEKNTLVSVTEKNDPGNQWCQWVENMGLG